MNRFRITGLCVLLSLLAFGFNAASSAAQKNKTTGGIKGKVKTESGDSAEGVRVTVRQGEREVASASTDRKGQFEINGLVAGRYDITFRKQGLSVAEVKDFEIVAGKPRALGGNVVLPIDEGSLVFVKGSVFTEEGRSLRGARVELARVESDGRVKKIDGRVSNESGSFSFRLPVETARYRVTAKMDGMTAASKDVEVEGAAVYRVALALKPTP
ncbi:MAG TPA: carboxypeptidase-like regulatory domain-containing protein [Pyrinomonadaceae bacterium]|nr:carboxypeptidase-like regulatory domain-containing protein [Pyrinomonadaceae bacterium]